MIEETLDKKSKELVEPGEYEGALAVTLLKTKDDLSKIFFEMAGSYEEACNF